MTKNKKMMISALPFVALVVLLAENVHMHRQQTVPAA